MTVNSKKDFVEYLKSFLDDLEAELKLPVVEPWYLQKRPVFAFENTTLAIFISALLRFTANSDELDKPDLTWGELADLFETAKSYE